MGQPSLSFHSGDLLRSAIFLGATLLPMLTSGMGQPMMQMNANNRFKI